MFFCVLSDLVLMLIILSVILHLFAFCDMYKYIEYVVSLAEFVYLYTPNSRYLELRLGRDR